MKPIVLLFIAMVFFHYSSAQNYEQYRSLDYPTIDSLMMGYYRIGAYNEAIALMKVGKEKAEIEFGQQDSVFAEYTSNLGFFYNKKGDYAKALPLYTQTVNIIEKNYGTESSYYANSLNNLAVLYEEMKAYKKALPLLIQATDIRKKKLGKMHQNYANSLYNLASLYQSMEKFQKALPLYIEAKNIIEKVLGNMHPNYARSLHNLATLYQRMENFEKALPLSIETINLREKILGKMHPDYARSLHNLAVLYQQMKNTDKAWASTLAVIEACTNIRLSTHISLEWADTLLAATFSSNLHLKYAVNSLSIIFSVIGSDSTVRDVSNKQIILTDLATALLRTFRNNLSDDKDKLRILSQSSLWLQKSLACHSSPLHNKKAFALVDQNKSVLLLQASKSEQTYRVGNLPETLIAKDKKLIKIKSQLQAKLVENRPKEEKDSLFNQLSNVNQEMDDFLEMIKTEYPKYHKLKYLESNTNVTDIQQLLDNETALIEYVIGDSAVHIFYVDKKEVHWKKTFVAHKKLKRRIKNFHQVLSDYKMLDKDSRLAYRIYTKQADWFYQQLLAPVLNDREGIKNLILVTDGELGHLPFETFLVERAPQNVTDYHKLHYLLNDYNISYNYSATLWKENEEAPTPKNNNQIMAVAANYDLKLDSSMIDLRLATDEWLRSTLKSLPYARKEVEALQKKYQGFFAFDQFASEKVIKEKASDFAVLHFATHGILNAKKPILSSLALSEDNDSLESNLWQAHEISKIELNANLVVLSACETGFGKFEQGNGIASLARSFMYAGTPSLVVSLWQVNDQATSAIMQLFYYNLENGLKKDEALRQAKLTYIKGTKGIIAHPVFWSPFIQIGNTRPISIKRKGEITFWLIGGGIALFVLITGFAISRRKKRMA